jgi:hypothetical protein
MRAAGPEDKPAMAAGARPRLRGAAGDLADPMREEVDGELVDEVGMVGGTAAVVDLEAPIWERWRNCSRQIRA